MSEINLSEELIAVHLSNLYKVIEKIDNSISTSKLQGFYPKKEDLDFIETTLKVAYKLLNTIVLDNCENSSCPISTDAKMPEKVDKCENSFCPIIFDAKMVGEVDKCENNSCPIIFDGKMVEEIEPKAANAEEIAEPKAATAEEIAEPKVADFLAENACITLHFSLLKNSSLNELINGILKNSQKDLNINFVNICDNDDCDSNCSSTCPMMRKKKSTKMSRLRSRIFGKMCSKN